MSFSEWQNVTFGEVCETISETHKVKKGKLIFLNTGDIERGKILHKNYSLVEKMPGQAKKSIKKGDILFSEIRPANGRWAYVDFDSDDFIVSTKLMVLRANEKIHSKYLYHLLTSPEIVNKLQQLAEARSGTFPQITFTQLSNIEFRLPPKETQIKIASFFDSLEKAIESALNINSTLESIALNYFKKLFQFQANEIPIGFKSGTFQDVAIQIKESIKPSQNIDKYYAHYSLPAFDANEEPSLDLGLTILSNKTQVKKYSVLISKLNPRIPRIWPVGDIDEKTSICSTEFIGFTPKQAHYYSFIVYFLKQNETTSKLAGFATGTSSSHQRVKPENILKLPIIIPPDSVIKSFDDIVKPFLEERFKNIKNILTIQKLRECLLPKLLNGEIEI